MSSKRFFLPNELYLKEQLSHTNTKSRYLVKHIDKFYYVIDKLYTTKFIDKRYTSLSNDSFSNENDLNYTTNNLLNNNTSITNTHLSYVVTYSKLTHHEKKHVKREYINLNSLHLRKVLTSRFDSRILHSLIEFGVIESDNQYIVGQKSKGYRLTNTFHNSDFISCDITDKRFYDKLIRLQQEKYNNLSGLHQEMFSFVKSSFTYDLESAYKYLNTFDTSYESKISIRLNLEKIKDKDFYFSTDTKTGRVFNNYTNLKREFRQFIKDKNGSSLTEIDIRNSQPLFLSVLVNQYYNNNLSYDVTFYKNLCETGKFYDYLSNELNLDREIIKKQILTILFSPEHWKNKVKELFTEKCMSSELFRQLTS